jgi:hypothetical protein
VSVLVLTAAAAAAATAAAAAAAATAAAAAAASSEATSQRFLLLPGNHTAVNGLRSSAPHSVTCSLPLAPPGGLDLQVAQQLSPFVLFMAALSDFAYVKDFGTGTRRRPCGPCLQAWGAVGEPSVIDATDPAGGVSHCTVFRTEYDVFVVFRQVVDNAVGGAAGRIPPVTTDTAAHLRSVLPGCAVQ